MNRKAIVILSCWFFFLQTSIHGSPVINTEDHPSAKIEMKEMTEDHLSRTDLKKMQKEERHLLLIEKKLTRMQTIFQSGKHQHALGGISDPVDRWFWIWIGTWGLGILITVLFGGGFSGATIGIIWFLAFAIGSIALVLWLVKKFG